MAGGLAEARDVRESAGTTHRRQVAGVERSEPPEGVGTTLNDRGVKTG